MRFYPLASGMCPTSGLEPHDPNTRRNVGQVRWSRPRVDSIVDKCTAQTFMPRRLKTYTTSAGFFDLAVAAPSMKAALEAWGSTRNLFHEGFAKASEDRDGQAWCRPPAASGHHRLVQ